MSFLIHRMSLGCFGWRVSRCGDRANKKPRRWCARGSANAIWGARPT